jgi:hypothetical protein
MFAFLKKAAKKSEDKRGFSLPVWWFIFNFHLQLVRRKDLHVHPFSLLGSLREGWGHGGAVL